MPKYRKALLARVALLTFTGFSATAFATTMQAVCEETVDGDFGAIDNYFGAGSLYGHGFQSTFIYDPSLDTRYIDNTADISECSNVE